MNPSSRRLRDIDQTTAGASPGQMDVDELVRLTMTEADVVAQIVGGVTRLQQVQQAKALLAQIEDPVQLRGVLSKPAAGEKR